MQLTKDSLHIQFRNIQILRKKSMKRIKHAYFLFLFKLITTYLWILNFQNK